MAANELSVDNEHQHKLDQQLAAVPHVPPMRAVLGKMSDEMIELASRRSTSGGRELRLSAAPAEATDKGVLGVVVCCLLPAVSIR